ncbi:PRC and DUF2382 domain-containing protein [Nocardia vaccinii]|uniref:PRC and DUF2382 domain-containing protein n=1 Tax=Nocardia vaccinii TaxID=1822 RepID=UPI0008351EF4|nr:PRC and DUF2382 domain-containing protein [Nocardia vaccinii]
MAQTLESAIGNTVYDSAGDKIGKVKQIYVDNVSGTPTWAAVSTGMFRSDSMVPLAGAQHQPDKGTLQVGVDKAHIKSAPYLDDDGRISPAAEQELLRHYGVNPRQQAVWNRYGRQRVRPGPDEPMTHGRSDADMIRSEERLEIGAERQETGTEHVVTENQTVDCPTTHEQVHVERDPITGPSQVRSRGDMGDQERADHQTVSDTVRKERVDTEGIDDE